MLRSSVRAQNMGMKLEADPYTSAVTWPGGSSGLTIGWGCDLGYATKQEIEQHWMALGPQLAMRLGAYCNITGSRASALVGALRDVVIPEAIATDVYLATDWPRTEAQVLAAFPGSDKLSPDSFGAMTLLVYNRGTGMTDAPGDTMHRRLEMRQIRDDISTGNFAAVPGRILSMKRLWVGQGLDGLLARRDDEAALFADGLDETVSNAAVVQVPAGTVTADSLMAAEIATFPTSKA